MGNRSLARPAEAANLALLQAIRLLISQASAGTMGACLFA
jgi:hypothetical protein